MKNLYGRGTVSVSTILTFISKMNGHCCFLYEIIVSSCYNSLCLSRIFFKNQHCEIYTFQEHFTATVYARFEGQTGGELWGIGKYRIDDHFSILCIVHVFYNWNQLIPGFTLLLKLWSTSGILEFSFRTLETTFNWNLSLSVYSLWNFNFTTTARPISECHAF